MPPSRSSLLQCLPVPVRRPLRAGLRLLQSMELALTLLAVIALACLAGTLLPQADVVPIADIQRQFGDYSFSLQALGLFHIFSSNWFIALLVLFFFSLLFGSVKWLRPAWHSITRQPVLGAEHIKASANARAYPVATPPTALEAAAQYFQNNGYQLVRGTQGFYAHKHTVGRFGPIVAHIALLLMLLGWLYGAFFSFTAQMLLPPATPTAVSQAGFLKPSLPPPYWLGQVPPYTLELHQFTVDYYEDTPRVARQYTSTLTVRNSQTGDVLAYKASLSVNHPLVVGGLTVYQASFSPTGAHYVQVNGQFQRLTAQDSLAGRPVLRLPVPSQTQEALLLFPYGKERDGVPQNHLQAFVQRNGQVVGLTDKATTAPSRYIGQEEDAVTVAGQRLRYLGPEFASGLQIKAAPEVPLLYASWVILTLALLLSLLVQRRVWVATGPSTETPALWVTLKTRKGLKAFKTTLYDELEAHLKASAGSAP